MKVAIVHYWLVGMRGGESVVEALGEMFPQADIFTHVCRPEQISERIKRHRIRTTFIARLPFASKLYKKYLPLMPLALEQLDLRDYDLVISSESGPAKGVIVRPDAVHICYCHTPMRYAWNMYHDYLKSAPAMIRVVMPWLMHRLRLWDALSAARVDFFIANSQNVAQRIRRYYGRSSVVVYPPVSVEDFAAASESEPMSESFYLCVGELVAYKRIDLAIAAFNEMKKTLIIIGDGEEYHALKKQAGPTIQFLGRQDFSVLRNYFANCRAFVYPGEEDFGIVMVEAIASGRPVIAYGRGGALEIVVSRKTGIFFEEQTAQSLVNAVREFESVEQAFQRSVLTEHARQYSRKNFESHMRAAIDHAFEGVGFLPFRSPGAIAASAWASPAHVGRSNSQEVLQ